MHLRAVTSEAPADWGAAAGDPGSGLDAPPAVLRAISMIHERYSEPITLAELASEVFISPFHFSRVFAKATGLTPGRFLTAVRLFQAKRLLLTTSLSVADVVCGVGYSSVGTFTSRFSRAVGMTPTQYRDPTVNEMLVAVAPGLTRLPSPRLVRDAVSAHTSTQAGTGTLTARVWLPRHAGPAQVLVGVFAEAVPQRGPVAFGGLVSARGGDHVTIRGVPSGRWTAMAVAEYVSLRMDTPGSAGIRSVPVVVPPNGHAMVTMDVRPPRLTDAPIAITLASPSRTRYLGPALTPANAA